MANRRILLVLLAAGSLGGAYLLGRQHHDPYGGTARRILYYVDPMHPSFRSNKPGIAPDCGMSLVPVYDDSHVAAKGMEWNRNEPPLGSVRVDYPIRQALGIRVAEVQRGGEPLEVHTVGRVMAEDTRVYRINPGVDGFIRETWNDAAGTRVVRDQRLATYYAPDFLAAASGFLAANERVPGAVAKEGLRGLQNYMDRLRNLGMSDLQIRQMAESKQLPESIDVVSPTDGFILSRSITPGQHFEHGMEFYRIADLSHVWVVAEISDRDVPFVRPGNTVSVSSRGSNRKWRGVVTESLPQSESGGSTTKIRIEIENPGMLLRPDMLVEVNLLTPRPSSIIVPLDALVEPGDGTRVYVETTDGLFEPRDVHTGWRTAEMVEILSGLKPGERVVSGATFLIDSESRLQSDSERNSGAPPMETNMARPKFTSEVKSPGHTRETAGNGPDGGGND